MAFHFTSPLKYIFDSLLKQFCSFHYSASDKYRWLFGDAVPKYRSKHLTLQNFGITPLQNNSIIVINNILVAKTVLWKLFANVDAAALDASKCIWSPMHFVLQFSSAPVCSPYYLIS